MDLAVVAATQGDGELVADLTGECSALGKSEMVGIGGSATANETRVLGNKSHMNAVTYPARLRQGRHALIDHSLCYVTVKQWKYLENQPPMSAIDS